MVVKNKVKQYFKEFVHNAIIHPLMMLVPVKLAHKMHDRNADWAFGLSRYDEIEIEKSFLGDK